MKLTFYIYLLSFFWVSCYKNTSNNESVEIDFSDKGIQQFLEYFNDENVIYKHSLFYDSLKKENKILKYNIKSLGKIGINRNLILTEGDSIHVRSYKTIIGCTDLLPYLEIVKDSISLKIVELGYPRIETKNNDTTLIFTECSAENYYLISIKIPLTDIGNKKFFFENKDYNQLLY